MITINRICDEVANYHGVSVTWFMGGKASRTRSRCRKLSMGLTREIMGLTWDEIGEQFGFEHPWPFRSYRAVKDDKDFNEIKTRLIAEKYQ